MDYGGVTPAPNGPCSYSSQSGTSQGSRFSDAPSGASLVNASRGSYGAGLEMHGGDTGLSQSTQFGGGMASGMISRAPSLAREDSFGGQGPVISKGPTQPTTQVVFSTQVVPTLVDSLMNPVAVNVPSANEDIITLVNVIYVGGLFPGTSNEFIINILQKCGKITHFKRHTDPSNGVVANFAFCDFDTAGGAYYAMNCLSGLSFGNSTVKVRCSNHVLENIEVWKAAEIADIKKENPGISDEEALSIFQSPEEELKEEFITLMKFEVVELQKAIYQQPPVQTKSVVDEPTNLKPQQLTRQSSQSDTSPSAKSNVNDLMTFTTRDYKIHHKESHRKSKARQKKHIYDDRLRRDERDWLSEEASMLRKLQRVGKIKPTTRERLIQDDLCGRPASNPRGRERERELDAKDAQEEAEEIAAMQNTVTVHVQAAPMGKQPLQTVLKAPVPTVFGNNLDDDDDAAMFAKRHRPLVPLGRSDEDIWKLVPNNKEQLYAFNIDWDTVLADGTLSKLLEPWVTKCIFEFLGDDKSLVTEMMDFLEGRLQERPTPQELLTDVEQFLDEESAGFVFEIWRRLVFQHFKLLHAQDE
ncbi:bifunctional RBM25 [Babesia duncani]|uniref:Bifunctional RBM25 n=1 Tax=Babesia duncani TaxID=323732 RepID=A0AAD9PP49_9APIC|nr:bifunctional RBM25 [Babesia duncani]